MENLRRLIHLFVTVFLSNFASSLTFPAMTDVIVAAVCGGKDECSLSIYLTGCQQVITGLGAVLMMPLIGKLSDVYGRKTILQIPLTLTIVPLLILSWNRTTNFFYAYYAFKTLTSMITDNGVLCLSLGYLADNVSEGDRVSAFGVLSGVLYAASVSGTLAARLLSISQIFQVAAGVSVVALVYVRVLLEESETTTTTTTTTQNADDEPPPNLFLEQPLILKPTTESRDVDQVIICESSKKTNFIQEIPSPNDIIRLLRTSIAFSLVACVSFCHSFGEAGLQSALFYFLKAQFGFKKDQNADILLISFGASMISSFFFLPLVGPFIGEEALLVVAMFAGFINNIFTSIAWSSWVLYASTCLSFFFTLANPISRSLVSKHNGPNEQGIAQGCILGLTSLANLISPLVYSPISASFLSEDPPFHFPGFGVFCIGLAYLIGFIPSVWIMVLPYFSTRQN